jgi:uncharacterized protein (DUF4415 family)
MKIYPTIPEFKEGLGFSREDWDAVDFPEITDEELARMRPIKEGLPWLYEAAIKAKEAKRKQGERGKQKAPTKIYISIGLDRDVLEKFKSTGSGWQTRINNALKTAHL